MKLLLHLLTSLIGPAARCKPKMVIWRSWSCASVSGLLTEPLNWGGEAGWVT